MTPQTLARPATLDDLMRHEGKAELIAGALVELPMTGNRPGRVALRIARRFDDWAEAAGVGAAYGDGHGFVVSGLSSGRQSFCPDAAYMADPPPEGSMRFIDGPPTLAVEVRSENDYGPAAERDMAAKRADYFEAGTRLVWDVDCLARTVTAHRPAGLPQVFGPAGVLDAPDVLPGFRLDLAALFPSPA